MALLHIQQAMNIVPVSIRHCLCVFRLLVLTQLSGKVTNKICYVFFCFVLIENQTCSLEISFCQTNKHVSISLGAFFFTNSKSTAVFSTEM